MAPSARDTLHRDRPAALEGFRYFELHVHPDTRKFAPHGRPKKTSRYTQAYVKGTGNVETNLHLDTRQSGTLQALDNSM